MELELLEGFTHTRTHLGNLRTLNSTPLMYCRFVHITSGIRRKYASSCCGMLISAILGGAEKLGTSVDSIQTMCKALCHALLEAARSVSLAMLFPRAN